MSFCSRPLVAEHPKAYAIGGSRRVPYPYPESPMYKFISRTLFATAMFALTLNNGIDVWRKLRPDRVQLATLPQIEAPDASLEDHNLENPDQPEIHEPEIRNVIPGGPADHLAQAIPVVAPLKLAVRKEAAENRSTARTPEQVARLLAAVSAENPRLSPVTGRPLAPRCSNGKCDKR